MRPTAAALLLLLLPGVVVAGDLDKLRAEIKQAVLQGNERAVRECAGRIAAADSREAVDALLDTYALTAGPLKMLWAEKIRWIREADANSEIEWENGLRGSSPAPGSLAKYEKLVEAQRKGKDVEQRIMRLETMKRHIVQALAGMKSDAALKELVSRMKSDSNWERRAGTAEVLGLIDHPTVVPALIEQLRKESEAAVRVACIDALHARKACDGAAIGVLAEQLRHEYWQVRFAAAAALRASGSKAAVEPLIDALKGAEGRLRHEFNDALVALTGVDKHGDHAAWRAWWQTNQEAVRGGEYQPKPEERPAKQDDRGTTFYGIPVRTKNVIFVIDCSGSMAWESEWKDPGGVSTGGSDAPYSKPAGTRKIDVARWQLHRCVAGLADGTEFNIIFFSTTFQVMSDRMVRMGASTRRAALEFVDRLSPEGGTNIYDPLEKAFGFAGASPASGGTATGIARGSVDTIFLLTDGMPNSGQVPAAEEIVAKIREMNRLRKIVVNAVGVFSSNGPGRMRDGDEKEEGEKFLKRLAEENGGLFVDASRGPASFK